MTDPKEFYGATVEEAVNKAAAVLGVPPDELSYSIVDPGSTGFLGMGARDARIVVESHTSPAFLDSDKAEPEQHLYSIAARIGDDTPRGHRPVSEEVVREAEQKMRGLLEAMGFMGTVDVYDAGDIVAVDVSLQETGLFIGHKGETIDAIQYLLNVMVYRSRTFEKKLVVDSEGYRQRRKEAIEGMAHRTARRAIREHRTVELPPMNAADRRIVHLFLKENSKVSTSSEGVEESRRVVIRPV